jgi:protein SCO1/2
MKASFLLMPIAGLLFFSCQEAPVSLPILGEREVVNGDTVYHKIRDFAFLNQDSQVITNATFGGKIYVADFFFISCPTICPKTTRQMLRLYERFKEEDKVILLAHTVDPKRDGVAALSKYAGNLGVSSSKWHFATGDQDALYEIADDYFSVALEDPDVPGGFDHSGRFILVDPNRHIRSFCDGTDPADVDRFMADIENLLKELK